MKRPTFESGRLSQRTIKPYDGGDFRVDPLPDKPGYVTMVPSGDVLTLEKANMLLKANLGL